MATTTKLLSGLKMVPRTIEGSKTDGYLKFISACLLLIFWACFSTNSMGASRFSVASGNWSSTSTWSSTSGGASGASAPVAGDVVTIEGGFNVTLTADAECASITFTTTTATSLTLAGFNLVVSGNITIPRSGAGVNLIAVGTGTLSAANIAFTSGGGGVRHQITISTGTVSVSGDITTDNTGASASITFSGAGTLNVGGQLLSSGTVGGTLTTVAGSTVNYNGSGAQTAKVATYAGNLTVSGSGVKTFATTPTVNGVLSMEGTATIAVTTGVITYGTNATLQYNTSTSRTTSTEEFLATVTATGGVVIKNTGTITFDGAKTISYVAIESGATLNLGGFTSSTKSLYLGGNGQSTGGTYGGTGSGATNINTTYFTANTGTLNLISATITSAATGNWGVAATWTGGVIPGSADVVTILAGNVITVNIPNATCATLNIAPVTNAISQLAFNANMKLTVLGTVTLGDAGNTNRRGNLNMTNAGILECKGIALGNAGANTYTAGSGTIIFTANNTLPTTIITSFNNLVINAGTTTLASAKNSTAAGSVTVKEGATLALSTFNYGATTAPTSLSLVGGAATGASITGSGTFSLGGNVTVFDAATGTAGATVSCPVSLVATRTFTIEDDGTTAIDVTFSGQISGAAGIIKAGAGTMSLSGGNTFSGSTTVNTGILNIQNVAGLGTTAGGTTVASGAELQLQGSITIGAEPLSLAGSGTLGSSGGALYNISGTNTFGGAITLTEGTRINSFAGTLTLGGTVDLGGFTLILQGASTNANLISGIISSTGSGAIQKVGAGNWALSGVNTFTGGVQLLNGSLDIRNAAALGTTAGTFSIGGVGNAVTIDNGSGAGITTSNYPISLADNFTFTGSNALNLGTGTVTLSADRSITATASTLTIGGTINDNTKSITKLGAGNVSFGSQAVTLKDITISAGTLTGTSNTLTVFGAWSNSGTFTHNSGTVAFTGSAAQTIAGSTNFNNLTINNSLGVTGTANHTVSGNLVLSSANPSSSVGTLDMGSNVLTMVGSTTGQGDVTGIISRTSITASTPYTFGNQYTSFTFTSGGTLPSSVSVQVNLSNPSWKTNAINRYYSVIQSSGTSGCRVSMRLHYLQSELNGLTETGAIDFFDYHGSAIVHDHGHTAENSTDNWIEISNLSVTYIAPSSSSFSAKNWTLGQSLNPNFTWIGPVSTDWTDADNWSGGVPSDTSDVVIPDASTTDFDPTTTTASVKSISISNGGILNGGGTLTVVKTSGAAWMNDGGTFNPGSGTVAFTGSGATLGGSTTFNNVSVGSGATLQLSAGSELKIAGTLTLTGSLDATTFDNTVEFNKSTGGQTINPINYNNLKVSNTSGTTTISGTVGVSGLFTPGGQAYTVTGSTVNFNGTTAGQAIPALTYNSLGISNSSKTLSGAVNIGGTLTLTSGIVTTSSTNLLTLASGSSLSGGSSTSYIYGPMKKIGNTNFTFPIGKDSGYARLGISNNSGTSSDFFTVEYFSTPYADSTLGSGLTGGKVSRKEYWLVTPSSNSLSANVTLYWENGNFSGIRTTPSASNLVVAHFNGSNWISENNTGLTGATTSGSVTSATVSSWSPFTFGSPNGNQPLPVKLISFTASAVSNDVVLRWATATEIDNDYFDIERSVDGINFVKVGQVKGNGNSSMIIKYSFMDKGAIANAPILFYRLKQVDYSGVFEFTNVISVRSDKGKGVSMINQLPNPFEENISVTYSLPEAGDVTFNIVDAMGRIIRTTDISGKEGVNLITFDTSEFPQGIYMINLNYNGARYVSGKVVKK